MRLFPNALYVARREYLQRVRSRAFVIVTAILVIVGLGIALSPVLFRVIAGEQLKSIGVSLPGDLPSQTIDQLQTTLNAGASQDGSDGPRWQLTPVSDVETARAEIPEDKLDGVLVIQRASSGDLTFEFITDEGITSSTATAVRQAASSLAIADRLERAGVAAEDRGAIFGPVEFQTEAPDPNAPTQGGEDFGGRYLVAFFFVILNFVAIVNYGNWVAGSVAEEKSSRVMELLVTAATPRQLLTGKLLGTGAAALTQYGALILALGVGFLVQGAAAERLLGSSGLDLSLPGLTMSTVLVALLFFVGGFILYCTLYAAAGSMVSRQEDVQQAGAPLMIAAMAGYFVSFGALSTPDAGWVQVASYIPFVSPYLVAIRAAFGTIAPWEVPIIFVILLVTIAAAIWLAARIYSAGVLLYGQRLSIRQVLRAARVAR
jgi:ABC-2 type transport system permease protein